MAGTKNLDAIEILIKFRKGDFHILLCTDKLARGIDIRKVGLVINCFCPRDGKHKDFALKPVTYLHRIARTGRFVDKGVALTFFNSFTPKIK